MLRTIINFMILILLTINTYAASTSKPIKHVIYITWDGVRWQDIFQTHERIPTFWSKYAKKAVIYGQPGSDTTMEVASVPVSLPSYQSQMAGRVQPACDDNECGKIKTETFPEYLVNKYRFDKKDVATFSSWEVTDDAVESVKGVTVTNDGTRPMTDPLLNLPDDVMDKINKDQMKEYPGDDTRLDKFTYAQAMHYFEKYQPKFMWISFGDSDEYAHRGNLQGYRDSLLAYDRMLDEMMSVLKLLDIADETMIIVTTDHGRGNGDNWTSHGEEYPESKQTWAFVLNGALLGGVGDNGVTHYSTLSIRPTVEAAFLSG